MVRKRTIRKPTYEAGCVVEFKGGDEVTFGVKAVRDGQGGMEVEYVGDDGVIMGIREGAEGLEMILKTP